MLPSVHSSNLFMYSMELLPKCIFLIHKINENLYLLSGILVFLSIYKGLRCTFLPKQEWRIGAEDSNIEIFLLWVLQCPSFA